MSTQIEAPKKKNVGRNIVEWQPIREAYCQRSPRPSYTELSEEFSVSLSGISSVASEEAWDVLRAGYAEQKLKESGAATLLLKAIEGEGVILTGAREITTRVLIGLRVLLEELSDADKAPKSLGSRADILNTVTFALANLSKFMESVGLVGMHKELRKLKHEGKADGSWENGVMQQINVTVQNLQSEAKQAGASKAQPVKDEDMG